MKILLAEDEISLARAIVKILERNHYTAEAVFNGEDALAALETGNYDAAILDIMMPKMDGITVLKKLRVSGCTIPILILTALSEVDNKVLGLDSGANDYLTKPFDTKELLARLRAITRIQQTGDTKIACGNVTLDRATFELSAPGGSFRLAKKEYQIMEMLMANPNNLIPTELFMEKIWGNDTKSDISVVWVYISYLRKKLRQLGSRLQIAAVRGRGYVLEELDDQGN